MTDSANLALPYLDAAQAQKHVTHNEALALLDVLTQLVFVARTAAPPAIPAEGQCWLVSGGTGAFAGKDNAVAAFLSGAWTFVAPRAGWRAWSVADATQLIYDGAAWNDAAGGLHALQNLTLLGVGTTADAQSPLSAKLGKALFAAKSVGEGGDGDLRFVLDKEGPSHSVSHLYQSNWSGRAETGLTGDDDFHLKVSADGALWREAIVVDCATGRPAFPQGMGDGAPFGFRNLLRNSRFAVNQRAVSGVVTLAAGAYGHDGVKAGAAGVTYAFATSGADVMLTIASGSLILPIDGEWIESCAYTLSQQGTAPARLWQGTGAAGAGIYAATPFTTPALTSGTQANVEFGPGTVLRPQFERGLYATMFERRPTVIDIALCLAYFQCSADGFSLWRGDVTSGEIYGGHVAFSGVMRAAPGVVVTDASAPVKFPAGPGVITATTRGFVELRAANASGAAGCFSSSWTASAEL